jgi:hypothetical protein
MKKVLKKFNRTLSIMLAAAMVLTMVPQTAMPVLAAENEVVEEASEASEVTDVTPADEDNESADVKDADDTDISEDSEITDEEQGESTEDDETPVIDEGNNSDENQNQEETPDVEEETIETPEEEAPTDDTAEETEEDASILSADTEAQAETKKISLAESEAATVSIYSVKDGGTETTLTKDVPYSIEDPEQRAYVRVVEQNADDLIEVMYRGEGADDVWTSIYEEEDLGYRIPDEKLHENLEIRVLRMRKITLDWQGGANWDSVKIFASAVRAESNYKGNLIVFGDRLGDKEVYGNKIYAPKDTKVELTISPLSENMQLSKVALQKGTDAAAEQPIDEAKGTSTFTVADEIADDYTLTIDGTASYEKAVLEGNINDDWGEIIPDSKGIYNVAPGSDYDLSAKKADGTAFVIAKVTVKENGTDSTAIAATSQGGSGSWTLQVTAEASGKTLQVGLYAAADATEPVDTITLKVAPKIERVTIKGATGDRITQQIGTKVKYALTLDNKLSKDRLSAHIKEKDEAGADVLVASNSSILDVTVEDGSLVVTTKASVKETSSAGNVVIINDMNGAEVASVNLETKAPAWVTAKPTLKLVSATDTELILDIAAPKGMALVDDDKNALFFYEVNAKGADVDKTKYVEADEQTTRFTFKVIDKPLGSGDKNTFEVTAQLFLYNDDGLWGGEENVEPAGTEIAKSQKSTVLKPATRKPYYADKITMKKEKAASALYTGQDAQPVATVDFGKNASYNSGIDVEIYDIPDGLAVVDAEDKYVYGDGNGTATAILGNDLKVKVFANKDAKPGKYTIKARTTYNKGSDSMENSIVQATASVQITVVQGIYDIDATAPKKIYRKTNSAATAKIAVTYNDGNKSAAPKTKKVTYDLVESEDTDAPAITVPGITVANGTIKIDKSYRLQKGEEAKEYTVRVKAADYEGNTAADYVSFEVTETAAAFGKVAVVKYDSKKKKYENLVLSDGTKLPINELQDGAEVVVVKQGRNTVGGYYLLDDIVDPALYTLTPAKGTSICREDDNSNYITVSKLGKNLVFKATATDGSKTSVTSNKFDIVYDDSVPKNEVTVVWRTKQDSGWELEKSGTAKLSEVPAGTVLTISVADKDKKELSENVSIYDYVLSATGAKTVKKYNGSLALDVIVNKNPAEITLKKGSEEVGKYKIEIPDLDEKAAAPKVSLKKGTKLYAVSSEQKLSFTMNKAVEGARYVQVSVQNNEADTEKLYGSLYDKETTLNVTDKEFSFDLSLPDYSKENDEKPELKKGASIAFVFLDRDRKALTKTSNTVKIKTTALKKSYKLNTKYTLSTRDAFSAPLTAKESGVEDVAFTKLYNANFGGNVNKFRTGFGLNNGCLELKTYYDEEAKETRAIAEQEGWGKNDFIGFVEYTVSYADGTKETFVTKIQVNLKKTTKGVVPTAYKYAASAVNALNPGENKTTEGISYVTTGKLNADIRAAKLIYASGSGKNTTYALEDANSVVQVKKVSGNEITFTIKGAQSKTATYNKAKLYVIPLSGMYAYENKYMDWGVNEWQKYGVELKCNVSLKAANSKGKIKSPAKSVSFLNVEPQKLALEDGKGKMYYYAELPYTAGIFAEIDDVKKPVEMASKQANKDLKSFDEIKDLIKVRKVSNKNALGFYIDQELFMDKVINIKTGEPSWSGVNFKQIELKVHFVGETEGTKAGTYTNAAPESFKISLTLPNPWDQISANENRLSEIIKMINGVDVAVDGIAYSSYSAADRTVEVVANKPNVVIKEAVDEKKEAMARELLSDPAIRSWVSNLKEITVKTNLKKDEAGKKISNNGDNKAFLIQVIETYTEELISELGEDATWKALHDRRETINLTIVATPTNDAAATGSKKQEETCTVRFVIDEEAVAASGLDGAIAIAVRKLSEEGVIDSSITGRYDATNHEITITGTDPDVDFIDAKNQGRDRAVQILLSELGEYMDNVESLTFSYEESDGTEDFVTVKKDGRETTEQYIADLVDTWTEKLVRKLNASYDGEGNPNAFGRLGGKSLSVEAKFKGVPERKQQYTMNFKCDMGLRGLDAAIASAVNELNTINILGVEKITYAPNGSTVKIIGNDSTQNIMDSKNSAKKETVQILVNNMDECMNDVQAVTFSYDEEDGTTNFVTVKRDDHKSTEQYISNLVDQWTEKLVNALVKQGKPQTYESLDGKSLEVRVKYKDTTKPERAYRITFDVQ